MQRLIRSVLLIAALAVSGSVWAQATPAGQADEVTPAGGAAAPPLPKPDETNAQRSKSQPGNNAPFWRGVRNSGNQAGVVSLPGAENGVLIQQFVQYPGSRVSTAGEAWRQVRNELILPYGGALLLIVALALALLYWGKGPLGGHEPDTGRKIERFTAFERAAHWANATAFVILAVSGIVMAFGKYFLLPVIGSTLFGWLTYALKNAHNFAGPVFAVSLIVVFLTFIRDNFPRSGDLAWLVGGAGLIGKEVPSHRYNAGEKVVFWGGVFLLGGLAVGSGLFLDKLIPGMEYLRGSMQVAHMIHSVAATLMMAMFSLHIYLGTVGVKGAYQGMRTGYVDEAWAKENHRLWYDDIKAGKISAQRSAAPRSAPAAAAAAK
jgi:formate dehydrogenase subunit gamma